MNSRIINRLLYILLFLVISSTSAIDKKENSTDTAISSSLKSLPVPTISPLKKIFTNSIRVTLSQSCSNECCKKSDFVYTLDGSDPRNSVKAHIYTKPITLTKTRTLKVYTRAKNDCRSDSEVLTKKYTRIEPLPLPEVTPKDGKLTFGRKVNLNVRGFEDDTTVRIYYSLDGSDPSTKGKPYREPFVLEDDFVVRAIAVSSTGEYLNSPILYNYFEHIAAELPTPRAVPISNNFKKKITVSLIVPSFKEEDSIAVYYTLDGSEPCDSSKKYERAIVIKRTTTLKAKAMKKGYLSSRVCEEFYSRGLQPVAPKASISQRGGVFRGKIPPIKLTCPMENPMIMFTLDGTEPSLASTLWDGKPIHLSEPATLKVKVFKMDWIPSVTVSETYEFGHLPAPVSNHSSGAIFNDSLEIILSMPDTPEKVAARIIYTLDGSDPQKHGRLYNGPITIYSSCIVKTYAKKQGFHDSKISTYDYFNMVKVIHAYYKDRNKDDRIDAAILHFNKPLQMLPSSIEFTDPFNGEKRRVESSDITKLNPESAETKIVALFSNQFTSGGKFPAGHYGRIPLPGEFDTAPFLIHDSTDTRSFQSASRRAIYSPSNSSLREFENKNVSIITNPFIPGLSKLPKYIVQMGDISTTTGTAIEVKPPRPSTGVAYVYDAPKNLEVLSKSLVEDPLTGTLYLVWDGRDRKGDIVDAGVYLVVMKIKEKQSGDVIAYRVNIGVKR